MVAFDNRYQLPFGQLLLSEVLLCLESGDRSAISSSSELLCEFFPVPMNHEMSHEQ